MAYRALYQEDRPLTFGDVVGQETVVQTLTRQIEMGRIFHAYLFAGPRGVGKTTIARILARAVNCRHPQGGEACGECAFCRSVNAEGAVDIIEIDGASNNRVDEVREIRDNVGYLPAVGRYRVYIVDEVHMLSNSAFNALLKTLEEPPEHIIFIFATTEPHKLPDTVLSRCQRYDFSRMSVAQLIGRMEDILRRKQRTAQPAALAVIARQAGGAMRDAVSMLDQCMTVAEGEITLQTVSRVLGVTDAGVLEQLEDSILTGDAPAAVGLGRRILERGADPSALGKELLRSLGDLFLAHFQPTLAEELTGDGELAEKLRRRAAAASPRQLTRITRLLSQLEGDLRFASQPSLLLEVTLARCAQLPQEQDTAALWERLERLEQAMAARPAVSPAVSPKPTDVPAALPASEIPPLPVYEEELPPPPEEEPIWEEEATAAPPTEPAPMPVHWNPSALRAKLAPRRSEQPEAGDSPGAIWQRLIQWLTDKGQMMYVSPMGRCRADRLEGALLQVKVPPPEDGTLSRMRRYTPALEKALSEMLGRPMKLEFNQLTLTPNEREFVEKTLRALPGMQVDITDEEEE